MSQLTRLREIDAIQAAVFKRGGIADDATYTPPTRGAAAIACTVLVDRNIDALGLDSRVATDAVAITLYIADVGGRPVPKATVVVGDETFTITEIRDADESAVVCIAKAGA